MLVLLPGLLCDDAVFADQRVALAARDVVVADYGGAATLPAMARGVLDALPAGRLAVCGHSMGARVALEMLRVAPQRIDRLALLDFGVDPCPEGDAGLAERTQRMALLELAERDGMQVMGARWAHGMVHPDRLGTPLFERIVAMVARKTPALFAAQIAALLARSAAFDVLAAATCPVLIGCGRQDAWSPLERHRQLHAQLPGTRLAVFEDAGHMAPMEQPDAVSAALRDWLDDDGCQRG